MNDTAANRSPISDRSGVTDAVRVQILATEHWNLLATRSMTWNEIFSRASMFITLLSAAVVALALVAQATGFGPGFRLIALLLLPVVLLMGLATVIRLGEANSEDFRLVVGMNRLRHAYLELVPELEPYFTTGQYDDLAGILESLGMGTRLSPLRVFGGTPSIVAAINVVVAGIIGALTGQALGAPDSANIVIGIIAALATAGGHGLMAFNSIRRGQLEHRPRFPRE